MACRGNLLGCIIILGGGFGCWGCSGPSSIFVLVLECLICVVF